MILLIDNSVAVTGAFKSALAMADAAEDRVVLVLPNGSQCLDYLKNDQSQHDMMTLPMLELSKSLRVLLYLPLLMVNGIRLARYVSANDVKVVHVNDMYNLLGVVLKLFKPSLRLIYHVRLLPSSYIGPIYGMLRAIIVRFADHIFCVSRAVYNSWDTAPQASVMYDFVQLQEHLPAKVQMNAETVTMIYLANYMHGKGQQHALSALAATGSGRIRVRFVGSTMGLVANEHYLMRLKRLAAAHGLESQVEFASETSDIEATLKAADIALNFSESESFSHTCLEALFYGLPLIATDSGGPAELFVDGQSGLLVAVGDIEAMAEAMLQLADSAALRQQLGEAGRAFVRAKFFSGADNSRHRIVECYSASIDVV